MDTKKMKAEKFSEELYFLLMSSQLRERIQLLGAKYNLSRENIKDEVHSFGESLLNQVESSHRKTSASLLRPAV